MKQLTSLLLTPTKSSNSSGVRPMAQQNCTSCKYFRAKQGMRNLGECFRYPPTVQGDTQRNPKVSHTGWCGEWRYDPDKDTSTEEDYA